MPAPERGFQEGSGPTVRATFVAGSEHDEPAREDVGHFGAHLSSTIGQLIQLSLRHPMLQHAAPAVSDCKLVFRLCFAFFIGREPHVGHRRLFCKYALNINVYSTVLTVGFRQVFNSCGPWAHDSLEGRVRAQIHICRHHSWSIGRVMTNAMASGPNLEMQRCADLFESA